MEKTKNIISEVPSFESVEISESAWRSIGTILANSNDYVKETMGNGLEIRFTPMDKHTYSLLLAYQSRDIFHFMWTEVDGVIDLTHRIVHQAHRGQGFATKIIQGLEERVNKLAENNKTPYLMMIDTSQLSVLKLGEKLGMKVTQGRDACQKLEQFKIDENTHLSDENGYRIMFRLSKLIRPLSQSIAEIQKNIRNYTQLALAA